jgi:hypothetical protein
MITKFNMKAFVAANNSLVSVKKQAPDTTVLKYKPKVFYKHLWCPALCELRGTVVDDNFDIVQRPFTKIFNVGEGKAPIIDDDSPVTAVEKINGFMGAATIRRGELFISTTGSIDSDFAAVAREHIEKLNWRVMNPAKTYIFEICDKRDRHIVPEQEGAHLLGARYKIWGSNQHAYSESELDEIAERLGCLRPNWQRYDTFSELKDIVRTVQHEGFVIWDDHGNEVKIKSPYYLATKFLGRKTPDRLEKLLADQQAAMEILDEEYYVVLPYLVEHKQRFIAMEAWDRMEFLREFFDREVIK